MHFTINLIDVCATQSRTTLVSAIVKQFGSCVGFYDIAG
jgi:hypothetical protein